ncbi:MAG: lipoyl(octanoyl) transferase LipB, partial [Deltaproteobacteria bacterium]|nr:lipoyl(octanoyl) transferase LipB [Deltaproteobacteria bacterium]
MKKEAWILNLETVPYEEAFELQKRLVKMRAQDTINDTLILLEHPPVLTVTRKATLKNILVSPEELEEKGISLCHTNRGGDITYHGPGQLVGYPIMNLKAHGKDLHGYVRNIEEIIIKLLKDYTITAHRDKNNPGVWVGEEKIAAVGIAVKSSWITMHGFSFNINPDLSHYSLIVPCGISDKGVTSLARLLGKTISRKDVCEKLIQHYGEVFNLTTREITLEVIAKGK